MPALAELNEPDELADLKSSPEWQAVVSHYKDREWRLDNLYFIRDEQGNEIRFARNEAQRAYSEEAWSRDLIVKARKLGFSTFIAVLITDTCTFRSGTEAGIVDKSLDDACDKLAMINLAYQRLPEMIKRENPLTRQNTKMLEWANGSIVSVGTTYRGGTPAILHISEFGKTSIDSPEAAHEIKTGAIQAVPVTGKVFVESTAHGRGGEFHEMVQRAEAKSKEGTPLTALDFKLHFYGWWIKKEYRLPNNLVIVPQDLKEYFADLEAKHGLKLDADQQAWYAKKHGELGPDDMKSEFPSVADETFFSSLLGAYFKREMSKARQEGRIGGLVPFDPTRRVNTFWDIGEDCTSIIFHQTDGLRHRIIDYYEEEGGSLQAACGVIATKAAERKFIYEKHYVPHDAGNREWGGNAQTRQKTAEGLGVKFEIVPRIDDKADSIEAARRFIGMTWFDAERTVRLVECLDNYRKKWNRLLGVFMSEPVHDWASHASDALQQGAMGLIPDKPEEHRHRPREQPRITSWAS